MGLSSFNNNYSVGGKSRFLCGGGDGAIYITLTSAAKGCSFYLLCKHGLLEVLVSTNNVTVQSLSIATRNNIGLKCTATLTKYAATETKPVHFVLRLGLNYDYERMVILANFPDTSGGDNAIIGIRDNQAETYTPA